MPECPAIRKETGTLADPLRGEKIAHRIVSLEYS